MKDKRGCCRRVCYYWADRLYFDVWRSVGAPSWKRIHEELLSCIEGNILIRWILQLCTNQRGEDLDGLVSLPRPSTIRTKGIFRVITTPSKNRLQKIYLASLNADPGFMPDPTCLKNLSFLSLHRTSNTVDRRNDWFSPCWYPAKYYSCGRHHFSISNTLPDYVENKNRHLTFQSRYKYCWPRWSQFSFFLWPWSHPFSCMFCFSGPTPPPPISLLFYLLGLGPRIFISNPTSVIVETTLKFSLAASRNDILSKF